MTGVLQRNTGHLLFALALLVAALVACAPHADGECASTSECRRGLTCQSGLCLAARACAPACNKDFHCDDGTCSADFAPQASILSPAPNAWFSHSVVNVTVLAIAPGGVQSVQVTLDGPKGASISLAATPAAVANTFSATWDTSPVAIAEGRWTLTAHITSAVGDLASVPVDVHIAKQGPQITLTGPDYGGATAFVRDGNVQLSARIVSSGPGVDPASVVVQVAGMKDQPGHTSDNATFTFGFSGRLPTFQLGTGDVSYTVAARDLAGNASATTGVFSLTRLKWIADAHRGLPIQSSPAVDGQRVYVGDDAGMLAAFDRGSGTRIWEVALGSAMVAAPVVGESLIYAATAGGAVKAVHSDGSAAWSCESSAFKFLASPALATIDGEETLFTVNDSVVTLPSGKTQPGGVLAMRASGFAVDFSGTRSCYRYGAWGKGRSSAAIGLDGAIYVGSEDRSGYRLHFAQDTSGVDVFTQDWSYATGSDVTTSPAISRTGAVLFGSDDATLYALDTGKNAAWTPFPVLTDKLLSSPVAGAGMAVALDRSGEMFAVDSATGAKRWSLALPGGGDVASTPAIGADGVVYSVVDRTVFALDKQGRTQWTLDIVSPATYSSPAMGCDGALYVGDAAGRLYAVVSDSPGLANDGWPRFRHDSKNSGNVATSLTCP